MSICKSLLCTGFSVCKPYKVLKLRGPGPGYVFLQDTDDDLEDSDIEVDDSDEDAPPAPSEAPAAQAAPAAAAAAASLRPRRPVGASSGPRVSQPTDDSDNDF